jgi:hypothetical protein
MKRRLNQLVAIGVEVADEDTLFRRHPLNTLRPIVLAGGIHAEQNRLACLEFYRQHDPDVEWRARIIYRWRSRRHLMRWIERGNSFRGVPQQWN